MKFSNLISSEVLQGNKIYSVFKIIEIIKTKQSLMRMFTISIFSCMY
jgi:hypothetical protein